MSNTHERRHPLRLPEEMYRVPDHPVFVTICAKSGRSLAEDDVPLEIVKVMGGLARRYGIQIHAYCIMPDHVHVVLSVAEPGAAVDKWVRYTKRESAKTLQAPGLWQRSYWDRHARGHEDVGAMVSYTLDNPVRWELCESWDQWPFSWCQWDPGGLGLDPNITDKTGAAE